MPAIGPCLFAFVVFACGCDARFIDLRPLAERPGSSGLPDLAGGDLAGGDLAGLDLAASEGVIARGPFTGRAGHVGTGAALLVRTGGSLELRFDAAFSVSNVPGPAIFLTSRTDMGGTIDAQTDINLGTLTAFAGAQQRVVPAGAEVGRRNVFIYCQPFRVEVAKAALMDVMQ